jgi:hypothetical protein
MAVSLLVVCAIAAILHAVDLRVSYRLVKGGAFKEANPFMAKLNARYGPAGLIMAKAPVFGFLVGLMAFRPEGWPALAAATMVSIMGVVGCIGVAVAMRRLKG